MKQANLGDLFDYLPKSRIKAGDGLDEGMYPFYTSSENQSKYLNDFQHEPGCLVFGTGGKASVHLTTSCFATSTDCITIKSKPAAGIDAGYVFQYFKGNMQVLENGFKGAGLKHISKAYLSDIQIPFPEEIDDQRRIAHLLGKVERLITQRRQHLQQLDNLLKSVFLEMFGDPVRNEKGWNKPTLKAFGKISTGNTPPRNDSSNYDDAYIEWIKTDNIATDSVFIGTATEYLSEAGAKRGRTVTKGALLVACIAGSVESIGRAALTDRTVAFNQQINAIQPAADVNPLFLYGLFKLSRAYIQSHATKGMKKILTKGDFEQIPMIKPPIDSQNQFAVLVEKFDALKSRYRQSLADLQALYGALSQQAFKGELDLSRVPLPNSERQEAPTAMPAAGSSPAVPPDAVDLPDTDLLLAVLNNRVRLKELLPFWLEDYCARLNGAYFSVQAFLSAAQTRIAQLHPDSDFELGAEAYEHVKAWVFDRIKSRELKQTRDIVSIGGKRNFGNKVVLRARSSSLS